MMEGNNYNRRPTKEEEAVSNILHSVQSILLIID